MSVIIPASSTSRSTFILANNTLRCIDIRVGYRRATNEREAYVNYSLLSRVALCSIHLLVTEKTPGVIRAASQYGTASRVIDLATFDVTHNPWRCGELFDAIVTDPPCKFTTFINCGARLFNI
jgi:hypothetical protein